MKYKAIYDAESDVPAEVKAFYHLVNGKWAFNYKEFEGLDGLANPNLEANRNDVRDKLEAEKLKTTSLETQLNEANKKVKDLEKPGTVAMTPADKEELDGFRALGALKDVKKKLEDGDEAIGEVGKFKTEKEIRQLARDTGVDEDALVDFKLNNERGKNVELSKEKKKVQIGKNKEEERWVLVAVKTDDVNGEKKKTNMDFNKFAEEEHLPSYVVKGIYAEAEEQTTKKFSKRTDFSLPSTTKEKTDDNTRTSTNDRKSDDKKERRFRDDRKLPWMKTKED